MHKLCFFLEKGNIYLQKMDTKTLRKCPISVLHYMMLDFRCIQMYIDKQCGVSHRPNE